MHGYLLGQAEIHQHTDESLADLLEELGEERRLAEIDDARIESAYTCRRALRCAGVIAGVDQLLELDDDQLVHAATWAEFDWADGRTPMPAWLAGALASHADVRRCRDCGCTDDYACERGCSWVGLDACSACAGMIPTEVLEVCRIRDPRDGEPYGLEPIASTWDLGSLLVDRRLSAAAYRIMAFDRSAGRDAERHDIGGLVVGLDGTWATPGGDAV